jgi:hypothetical protein
MQSKDCGKGFAVDRERCEFSALPALSRSSAQFCDPFGLDLETTVNSSRRPAKKPAANRWGCCILGWRTGSKICLPPVYEPYAVGRGSVHSRAKPNGVRSAVMPGFRWTGVNYEVDPDLAGEMVILWWGIFDNELYVEHGDKRFGPYAPVGGPIPLYRYRAFKKTPTQQRADRIEALAERLALPRVALENSPEAALLQRRN